MLTNNLLRIYNVPKLKYWLTQCAGNRQCKIPYILYHIRLLAQCFRIISLSFVITLNFLLVFLPFIIFFLYPFIKKKRQLKKTPKNTNFEICDVLCEILYVSFTQGALVGGVLGFAFSMWGQIGKYLSLPTNARLPTSTLGCHSNTTTVDDVIMSSDYKINNPDPSL